MNKHTAPTQVPRSLMLVALAVSLPLALSACAEPQVDVPPDVAATVAALTALPQDLYIAHSIVTNGCLDDEGFVVPFDSSVPGSSRATVNGVVGVFISEETARSSGYNSTYEEEGMTSRDQFKETLPAAEQKRFDEVLWGSGTEFETVVLDNGMEFQKSSDGCVAVGDAAVYGSVRESLELELFTNDVTTQTKKYSGQTESAINSLLPDYEACMQEAGYRVSGLHADQVAQESFGRYRPAGAAPNDAEQTMAIADFHCQESVELIDRLNELFTANASVWITEHEQDILALQEQLDASMSRAGAIINGG